MTSPMPAARPAESEAVEAGGPVLPPLRHARSAPLPPFLREEMSSVRLSSLMGLFPGAGLAWMTADDRLFLWSYDVEGGGRIFVRVRGLLLF